MNTDFSRPAYLETADPFCDGVMQALLCDGGAPAPVSMKRLSPMIDATAWRNSVAETPLNPLKHLTAAARYAALRDVLQQRSVDLLYVWRGLLGRAAVGACAAGAAHIPCVFFERGPVAGWLQIDMQGVNARCSVPRDAAFFRQWRAAAGGGLMEWRDLGDSITARVPRRNLVKQQSRENWSDAEPFLFVPFQLNQAGDPLPDASWVSDAGDLVAALAKASLALPQGWTLRLKPHPNARGDLHELVARHPGGRMLVDRDTNSLDQLRASRGVITVNSAMGLEAFFFDKPVITLGDSYYAGLGRTLQANSADQLSQLLRAPEVLSFDKAARDDLMTFLFNDFFVREEDLRSGAFDVAALLQRHARHEQISARLGCTD